MGERIAGSSGTPSGFHGLTTMVLWTAANQYDLRHIRFLYQRYAIYGLSTVRADISHCEFIKCNQPFQNDKSFWNIRNVLVQDAVNVFHGISPHTNNVEHLTARGVSNLVASGLPSIKLTNSLLISVTNGVSYTGANVETNLSSVGIFESVGSGYHYLNTNSPYRDAGTTNIDPTLWADLKKRTTYPPVILTNKVTSDTTLSMEVQRDTDTPDLGYHYAPIDFAFDTLTVTNATLTVQQGTALAMYGTTGIWLQDNSQLIAEGSPTNRVHFLRYVNVQEQPVFWGGTNISASVLIDPDHYGNAPPSLRLNFANADVLANGGYTTYVDTTNRGLAVFSARNAEFGGGNLFLKDATNATYAITNSVLEQLTLTIDSLSSYFQYNTTLRNVSGVLNGTNAWTFKDNLLDSCSLINSNASLVHDYNAFYSSTNFYWVHAQSANEFVLFWLTNTVGPLGRFYLNANMGPLFNVGSRNATNAGLYHFTCTTNQVKETNSVVDIGYHYVALDSNWIPLDYDSDGVPDYYEDFNGNGTWESGELNWQDDDTDGDGVGDGAELLQGRNPMGGTLADTNNVLNLRVFTPLK